MTHFASHNATRRNLLACLALTPLAACASRPDLSLASYTDERPLLVPEKVFDGKIQAWGVVQGPRGNIVRRMWVEINGNWDGKTLTIAEQMTFENGDRMDRTWNYRRNGPDQWIGSSAGIKTPSRGRVAGNAFNRQYQGQAHLPDGTMTIAQFDEWLWQLDDERLFCRAYISRWGVPLAQASVFFQKQA